MNTSVKSHEIAIARFRQILIWPLALRLTGLRDTRQGLIQGIDAVNKALERHTRWCEIKDLLDHAPPPGDTRSLPYRKPDENDHSVFDAEANRAQAYAEFVYFYDFLQSTLFHGPDASGGNAKGRFRLWQRTDVKGIAFSLLLNAGGARERVVKYRAKIVRFNLYIFDTGAAVLVVELDYGAKSDNGDIAPKVIDDKSEFGGPNRRLTLEDALTVNDHLRRVYTPFFFISDDAQAHASHVPKSISWLDEMGAPIQLADGDEPGPMFEPKSLDKDYDFIRKPDNAGRRTAPVADH